MIATHKKNNFLWVKCSTYHVRTTTTFSWQNNWNINMSSEFNSKKLSSHWRKFKSVWAFSGEKNFRYSMITDYFKVNTLHILCKNFYHPSAWQMTNFYCIFLWFLGIICCKHIYILLSNFPMLFAGHSNYRLY
jgi:hypothetical protein